MKLLISLAVLSFLLGPLVMPAFFAFILAAIFIVGAVITHSIEGLKDPSPKSQNALIFPYDNPDWQNKEIIVLPDDEHEAGRIMNNHIKYGHLKSK